MIRGREGTQIGYLARRQGSWLLPVLTLIPRFQVLIHTKRDGKKEYKQSKTVAKINTNTNTHTVQHKCLLGRKYISLACFNFFNEKGIFIYIW